MKKRYIARATSILVAIYVLISIPGLVKAWDIKITQQSNTNVMASNANDLYESLKQNIMKGWEELFHMELDIDSLVQLGNVIDVDSSGLLTPTSLLQRPEIVDMPYNGQNIGVVKVCVKNSPQGYVVGAKKINELITGMRTLEQRIDTEIGNYKYINHKGTQQIIMDQLCVLLRTAEAQKS